MKSQVLFLLVFLSCLPAKDGENKMFLVSNFVMSQKIAIFAQIIYINKVMKHLLAILAVVLATVLMPHEIYGQKVKGNADEAEKVSTYQQKVGWMPTRYLFGVATSYADSITMVTMVAPVDSMAYDKNTKTLLGLDLYTTSFRNFLEAQGRKGYICSTFVCETEKEAESRLTAVCKRVNKKKQTRLESADGFLYHRIATEYIYTNVGEDVESEK